MSQTGKSTPQQCHGAGNVGSCHGCAAGGGITTVTRVTSRARARTWSSDIRLDAVTPVSCHWSAAAKSSDSVGAGSQRADCIGSCIE